MKKPTTKLPDPPDEKMIFPEDMFYDNPAVPLYDKGKEYLVPGNMVERWLMRGGVIVGQGQPSVQQVPNDPVLKKQYEEEQRAKADADRATAAHAKAEEVRLEEEAAAVKEAEEKAAKAAKEKAAEDEKAAKAADKKSK